MIALIKIARRVLCLCMAAGVAFSAFGETPEERENALKAGFIYNFFSYIEWPQKSEQSGPFVVGIVGNDSYDAVVAALAGKSVKGRRIEVRKVGDLSRLEGYHLVFVSASEQARLRQILDQTRNAAILTVGESAGFTREGGIINLVPSRNRFQLEINPAAAEKAGLTISSQLLKLARIVGS